MMWLELLPILLCFVLGLGFLIVEMFLPGFASGSRVVNVGYGCAVSIISSIICAAIGILYMRSTRKVSELY